MSLSNTVGCRAVCLGIIFWCLFFPAGSMADTPRFQKNASQLQTFQLFYENDLFGDTDKYYTNAAQVTWLSPDLNQYRDDVRLPEWAIPVIRAIPFSGDTGSSHNVGFLLGQQIYTPSDIQTTSPGEMDRPYAGFLYGGLALHSKTASVLDTLEIVLGVVGPSALGRVAQNTVHEIRDIPTAKGWDSQLHNEPALRLSWQRKWRMYSRELFEFLEADLISHAGITLGNVRISAATGGEVRFGYHIPKDFGSDVIRAGAGVSAPFNTPSGPGRTRFGAHIFAGSQVEAVLHDIFLDGNTWQDSPSVDKRLLTADLSLGMAFNFDLFKLTYRHLFRTRQFDTQEQGQVIGSLTLTLAF